MALSPSGATVAGTSYPPGLSLSADATLWGFHASFAGALDIDGTSLTMSGAIDPVHIVLAGKPVLAITGAGGSGNARTQIAVTPAAQSAKASLGINLLGAQSDLQVNMPSADQITLAFNRQASSFYANANLQLQGARLNANGGTSFGYSFSIPSCSVPLTVKATLGLTVDAKEGWCSTGVGFSIDGVGGSLSATTPLPISSVSDLTALFTNALSSNTQAAQQFLSGIVDLIAQRFTSAFGPAAAQIQRILEPSFYASIGTSIGVDATSLAKSISSTFGLPAAQAVALLGVGTGQAISILENGFGETADQASSAFSSAVNDVSGAVSSISHTVQGWF
jgi:hypothetical protein